MLCGRSIVVFLFDCWSGCGRGVLQPRHWHLAKVAEVIPIVTGRRCAGGIRLSCIWKRLVRAQEQPGLPACSVSRVGHCTARVHSVRGQPHYTVAIHKSRMLDNGSDRR